MKREFIFLGPPACGKGTQTNTLSEYLKLPHVDTGSLLRAEIKNETEAGKEAKSYIDKGQLVPVELVTRIIKNRLSQDDCKNGYILDGFPRSTEQAEQLTLMNEEIDKGIETKFSAIYFDIDTNLLVERIVNRRSCPGFITFNQNLRKLKGTATKTVQNLPREKMTQERLLNQDLIHITKKPHL